MARTPARKEMSGIFDAFKKKPGQKSLFDAIVPGKEPPLPALPAPREKTGLPALPAGQKSLFDPFVSKKSEPSREVAKPKPVESQPIPWAEMFPVSNEPSPMEMFREARQEVEPPTKYVFLEPSAVPEIYPPRPYSLPTKEATMRSWRLPSAEEMAGHFQRTMNLDAMWEDIRHFRSQPNYKKDQLKNAKKGIPMMTPIDPIVHREMYTDFSNFYGIPWAVIEAYLSSARTEKEEKVAEDLLWDEVLSPLNTRLPNAFELLKPSDIPGFFTATFDEGSGNYYLYYVEPMLKAPPGGFSGS